MNFTKRELGISINMPTENVFVSGYFDCIEYSIGAKFSGETFDIWYERAQEIKALCKKYGVRLHSYHLPFNGERLGG